MSGPLGSAQWMYASGAEVTQQSLKFNDDESQYLSWTPASAGNRKTWTWSGWVKLGAISGTRPLFAVYIGSGSTDNQFFSLFFDGAALRASGYSTAYLTSTAVHRDPSAWYHVVCAVDTTNATANNRIRFYVNGDEITDFSARNNPSLNADLGINQAAKHELGQNGGFGSYFDGYLSDIYFIDGQALDPTSFGETIDGYWRPVAYSGTYGDNGFHLEFDGAVTDSSGNGNDWTANNISAHDYVPDSFTNNFAVLNPLAGNTSISLSEGNLKFTASAAAGNRQAGFGMSSGKWYWELYISSLSSYQTHGITTNEFYATGYDENYGYASDGRKWVTATPSTYGATYTTGDILGFALDMDAGTFVAYKNGVSQGTLVSGLTGTLFPIVRTDGTGTINANFGQDSTFSGTRPAGGNTDDNGIGDFAYAPPSGYLALCTNNLPTPTIVDGSEYFNTVLYTGNASTNAVTGVGFDLSADGGLVWMKNRASAYFHGLYDSVRGTGITKSLYSNATDAEGANSANQNLVSFDSDGFTLGSTTGTNAINTSGQSHASWNWKAGGAAVSNTDGSITSQVSANVDAGFSIVSYTGNGTGGSTIGHGLSGVDAVIVKRRDSTAHWQYLDKNLASGNVLLMSSTGAATAYSGFIGGGIDNLAATTFSVENGSSNCDNVNASGGTYIAYCFTNTDGYLKAGSYTGNGSTDGPFVYTGFRPAFVMFKGSSIASNWCILDNTRSLYNVTDETLQANSSSVELTNLSDVDFLSNGIKIRDVVTNDTNVSGQTYIYLAFAENPFKYANAR